MEVFKVELSLEMIARSLCGVYEPLIILFILLRCYVLYKKDKNITNTKTARKGFFKMLIAFIITS